MPISEKEKKDITLLKENISNLGTDIKASINLEDMRDFGEEVSRLEDEPDRLRMRKNLIVNNINTVKNARLNPNKAIM